MWKWFNTYGSWILIAILAGYIVMRYVNSQPDLINGTKAPAFTITALDGKEYSLSDFEGKYVFIDFWGSWCGPCRRANPAWASLYNELKEDPQTAGQIEFVSIASEQNKSAWMKAIEKDGLSWKYHHAEIGNPPNSIIDSYGVNSFPTNYLIDPTGMIIGVDIDDDFIRGRLE